MAIKQNGLMKMKIEQKIINLLIEDDYSLENLSGKIPEHSYNSIATTISRMKKKDLLIVNGVNKGFSVYTLNPKRFGNNEITKQLGLKLKFLMNFFQKNKSNLLSKPENKKFLIENKNAFIEIAKIIKELGDI